MKLGWSCNQYGSVAEHLRDCQRVRMISPGAPIRLDAINDSMALQNPLISQTFTIHDTETEVTVVVTSVVLPSPFKVTFRGPCHVPRVLNHSIGSSAARPYIAYVGTLADSHDVVEVDTKSRTARRCQDTTADPQVWEDVTDDISSGSTWFALRAGSNAIEINRDSSTGGSVNTFEHRNPAVAFDWGWLDARVDNIIAVGSKPLFVTIYYTPGDNRAQSEDPAVIAQHAEFIRQLVKRYKTKAYGIEADNEPNIPWTRVIGPGKGAPPPSLIAKVCGAIMPLIPDAWKRISPGLAPGSTADSPSLGQFYSPEDWLAEFWPLAGSHFDFVGMHPYGQKDDISKPWSLIGRLPGIFAQCGNTPIIATEYNGIPPAHDDFVLNSKWVAETLPYLNNLSAAGQKIVHTLFFYAMSDPVTDHPGEYYLGVYPPGDSVPRPVLDRIKYWIKHPKEELELGDFEQLSEEDPGPLIRP